MAPTEPDPRRSAALRPPRQRRPPLSPQPEWKDLFLAPRYTDPSIQREIDEEYAEAAPRSSFRR